MGTTRVHVNGPNKCSTYHDVPDEKVTQFKRDHAKEYSEKNGGKLCPYYYREEPLISRR